MIRRKRAAAEGEITKQGKKRNLRTGCFYE